MKVIVNSDILYSQNVVQDKLPLSISNLANACLQNASTLVLPRTAYLEFKRNQSENADKLKQAIKAAYKTLSHYQIPFTEINPDEKVIIGDLAELISKSGAGVEIVEPTMDDFRDAHERACLHASPCVPGAKSDEMRDLVIWAISLRIAKGDGGAILLSRDEVHTHQRGDAEADASKLLRFKSVDDVLDYFALETPAAKMLKNIFASIWTEFGNLGIQVNQEATILSIKDASYVAGETGIKTARGLLKGKTKDGKTFQAKVKIEFVNGSAKEIEVQEAKIESDVLFSDPRKRVVDIPVSGIEFDNMEALNELKKILEK
jgi:hypothetical protein